MCSEKFIEAKLVSRIKDLGGLCIKLTALHIIGIPDRLCLSPGSIIFFAELKASGKKPRKIQVHFINKLKNLGFQVYVIDSPEAVENLIRC